MLDAFATDDDLARPDNRSGDVLRVAVEQAGGVRVVEVLGERDGMRAPLGAVEQRAAAVVVRAPTTRMSSKRSRVLTTSSTTAGARSG